MSHLTTCEDSRSATCSQGSASGPTPSVSPDGLTISQSGQAPVRASLSARQAKEMGLLTSGTFGPTSSTSSASSDLSMSLANRLQAVTQIHGSTLYKQTWKDWATPSGLCRLRQRESVRRTSESGPTGWPTPVANTNPQPETKRGLQHVSGAARLTGWPTPTATNNDRSPSVERAMSMWRPDGSKTQQRLQDFAGIAGPLRLTVFGEMRTGSYVEMANGVQLNPAHSRWLMGLPRAWDELSPGWQKWQAATASVDSKATVTP